MRYKWIVVLLVVLAVGVGGYLYNKYRVAPAMQFSTLDLIDLNGNPIDIEGLKGKKVFVNFFGTWCGPCLHEFPILERTQAILENEGYLFICVSDEEPAKLKAFRQRVNARIVIAHSKRSLKEMGINSIPTNYVLNPQSEIVFKQVGEITGTPDEFAQQLRNINY